MAWLWAFLSVTGQGAGLQLRGKGGPLWPRGVGGHSVGSAEPSPPGGALGIRKQVGFRESLRFKHSVRLRARGGLLASRSPPFLWVENSGSGHP